jgi:hypothetical protein
MTATQLNVQLSVGKDDHFISDMCVCVRLRSERLLMLG